MKYHVAMLFQPHLVEYCKNHMPDLSDQFDIEYISYQTFAELARLYPAIKDRFDGFVTSGICPHQLLSQIGKEDDLACVHFRFDLENTYRILLEECVKRSSVDLSRVGIDFLRNGQSLARMVSENLLPAAASNFEQTISLLSWEELEHFENSVTGDYMERYRQGKLDFVLTYFHSTVNAFQGLPLDCHYLYPSANEYRFAMRTLEKRIFEQKSLQSLPAVIRIDIPADYLNKSSRADLYSAELQHLLLEAVNHLNNNLSLKSGPSYFELYTDSRTLSQLTNRFKSCSLMTFLEKRIAFHGTIGYGISSDFYGARANALKASGFAEEQASGKGGSYLVDQDGLLTCLKCSDEREICWVSSLPSDYVNNVAAKAQLSSQTIRKIIGVLVDEDTDRITSSELINHLGISLRTANRYLANLERNGVASVVGHRSIGGRGRPICIYRLDLDYKKLGRPS